MRVKVKNKSSRPTKEVGRLVRLGLRGLDIVEVVVEVVDARKHASGHAWGSGGYGEFVLRIPPDHTYPKQGWRRHRSSPVNHDHRDWRESVVALAAHEGRHIDISRTRYWKESAQQIEMACEAHERWVLDHYRESLDRGIAA